ncbi:hypothetical protein JCM10914A_15320 [Paenibacillus sp. JCM 10914]|uniref:DUF6470 family protein n=1 Tax=Paenibacillus sp. JCM 10914 TaxID=1236974 RepID=UPI0003CCB3B0|nr:DUF6470 family protein [Paenibacillus sp. JCM 10914]GAE09100.1 conserved protein YviE [Paenibacillus sp. JCM 10914]
MNFPRIQIQQEYSRLGIETTRGKHNIEQPRPSLNMNQQQGEIEVKRTNPTLEIDSRKAWSALGIARIVEVNDRIAQSSMEISMHNIAEIARNGDRMMHFQKSKNVFAEIARDNVFKARPRVEIVGEPGYDNVDVTFTPGKLQMNYTPGGVTFSPETYKPVVDYYPGKVNSYLIQKNYISMSVAGGQLNAVV